MKNNIPIEDLIDSFHTDEKNKSRRYREFLYHCYTKFEKEIKKRNGAFKKQTDDAITARFKNAKTDKDFDEAVIKISKRVLKALHDMHYKRTNLIDKMPVPKN